MECLPGALSCMGGRSLWTFLFGVLLDFTINLLFFSTSCGITIKDRSRASRRPRAPARGERRRAEIGRVIRSLMVLAALLACCAIPVLADEARYGDAAVEAVGFSLPGNLTDGSRTAVASAGGPAQVTLSRAGGHRRRGHRIWHHPPALDGRRPAHGGQPVLRREGLPPRVCGPVRPGGRPARIAGAGLSGGGGHRGALCVL